MAKEITIYPNSNLYYCSDNGIFWSENKLPLSCVLNKSFAKYKMYLNNKGDTRCYEYITQDKVFILH